jgi:hypothetical protein
VASACCGATAVCPRQRTFFDVGSQMWRGGGSGRSGRRPIRATTPTAHQTRQPVSASADWTGREGGSAPRVWRRLSSDVLLGSSRLLASLCCRGIARIAQSRQALHRTARPASRLPDGLQYAAAIPREMGTTALMVCQSASGVCPDCGGSSHPSAALSRARSRLGYGMQAVMLSGRKETT